jgi:head-tail adaptor
MRAEFAGTLRERVVVERLSEERSSAGLPSQEWLVVVRCMAAISADGVGAEGEAAALSAMPRFRVTIRPRAGVTVGQQLRWRDRRLMVRQVLADPQSPDRLVLRCEETRS